MGPSAGQEHGVARADRMAAEAVGHGPIVQAPCKRLTSGPTTQSDVDLRSGIGLGEMVALTFFGDHMQKLRAF